MVGDGCKGVMLITSRIVSPILSHYLVIISATAPHLINMVFHSPLMLPMKYWSIFLERVGMGWGIQGGYVTLTLELFCYILWSYCRGLLIIGQVFFDCLIYDE